MPRELAVDKMTDRQLWDRLEVELDELLRDASGFRRIDGATYWALSRARHIEIELRLRGVQTRLEV